MQSESLESVRDILNRVFLNLEASQQKIDDYFAKTVNVNQEGDASTKSD